jgi:hypothetical protein
MPCAPSGSNRNKPTNQRKWKEKERCSLLIKDSLESCCCLLCLILFYNIIRWRYSYSRDSSYPILS